MKVMLIVILLLAMISNIESTATINYPVRSVYIDDVASWWPPESLAAGMAVPGFAQSTIYNYVILAFWLSTGPADMVSVWSDPVKFFGNASQFGQTNAEIQANLKKRYNDAGIKIMISAFGATEFPTTEGKDPVAVATALGTFVQENNLDGVDIDWEDNSAMEAGNGQAWIIAFQNTLYQIIPNHIISHAPQGPYFKQEYYKNGAYVTVNDQVGSTIDFYNVQFYNQGNTDYASYDGLFTKAVGFFSGTSVKEIIARGVPSKKVVVGKPASKAEADNTGFVPATDLGTWTTKAYTDFGWFAGVMYWQYKSDSSGSSITSACGHLRELCGTNKNCK